LRVIIFKRERVIFVEIMEENPAFEQLTLRKLEAKALPNFENEEIHISKKTNAHLELEKERQLHCKSFCSLINY